MTTFKVYKLVPDKVYRDLVHDGNEKIFSHHHHQNDEEDRSIKSIQENNEMEFKKISNENETNTANLYEAPSSHLQSGDGLIPPLWVFNDRNTLPQYSTPNKLVDTFSKYKKILDMDLPEKLKIQLAQYYKDKYNHARFNENEFNNGINSDDENDDDDDNDDAKIYLNPQKRALEEAISKIRKNSKPKGILAARIGKIMIESPKFIKWEGTGDISHPKYANNLNLFNLLSCLVYAKKGSTQELRDIFNLIRPFYKKIKDHIINKSIILKIRTFRDSNSSGNVVYHAL